MKWHQKGVESRGLIQRTDSLASQPHFPFLRSQQLQVIPRQAESSQASETRGPESATGRLPMPQSSGSSITRAESPLDDMTEKPAGHIKDEMDIEKGSTSEKSLAALKRESTADESEQPRK